MTNKYFHIRIRGPGLTRAVQEAVTSRRELNIVDDRDNHGRLVRIGYFLGDESSDQPNEHDIKWFTKQEIEVLPSSDQAPPIGQARFDVNYTHNERQSERRFMLEIPLDRKTDLVFRNLFRVKRDTVSDFMIQVEIKSTINGKKKFRPIVRYDCAHGSIHRDLIVSRNRKIKVELPSQQASDAIPLAMEDIKTHITKWLQRLGWDLIAEAIADSPVFARELDRVKCKLLELYEHPELMSSIESQLVQYR